MKNRKKILAILLFLLLALIMFASANPSGKEEKLMVEDPKISLSKDNDYSIETNDKIPAFKAKALDAQGNELTVTITNNINNKVAGKYKVIFTTEDLQGNKTTIEREFIVVAPRITTKTVTPTTNQLIVTQPVTNNQNVTNKTNELMNAPKEEPNNISTDQNNNQSNNQNDEDPEEEPSVESRTYTIKFDTGVDNNKGVSGEMENQTCSYGIECKIDPNLFTRDYYEFYFWKMKNGSNKRVNDNGIIKENIDGETIVLKAIWKAASSFDFYYNPNGGSACESPTYSISLGTKFKIPCKPTFSEHEFKYWYYFNQNGDKVIINNWYYINANGDKVFTENGLLTNFIDTQLPKSDGHKYYLYAQW